MATKSKNIEQLEITKCKKSFKNNNLDMATLHAENAIRNRNDALNYLRKINEIDLLIEKYKIFTSNDLNGSDGGGGGVGGSPPKIALDEIKRQLSRIENMPSTENVAGTPPPVSVDDVGKLLHEIAAEINQTSATVVSMEQEELYRRLAQLRR